MFAVCCYINLIINDESTNNSARSACNLGCM